MTRNALLRAVPTAASAPRRAVALAAVLVAALLAGLLGAAAPAVAVPQPTGPMTLDIHKFEQPDQLGEPATGLPLDPAVAPTTPPVPGAVFSATRVPGVDLSTNAGQRAAAALTEAEARQRIADASASPDATETTDALGNATLALPAAGLYYVDETATPAGYAGAAPFLVALPLTDPVTRDGWLTTVHVYPKNAKAGVALDVIDRDAVALGDTVTWLARAGIPRSTAIDGYEIRNLFSEHVVLDRLADVEVTVDGQAGSLALGADYEIRQITAPDGRWGFAVEMLPPGLAKLAQASAADPAAQVEVRYPSRATADGALANEAILLSTRAQIDDYEAGRFTGTSDTAETRWGPLAILVHEEGRPANVIPGAAFELYLSAEDARAGRNPVVVSGVREWVTDADGRIRIEGLRLSDFVDGLDRAPGDPLFRTYYVMLTEIPSGWTGSRAPLPITVTDTEDAALAVVQLHRGGDAQAAADAGGSGADPGGEGSGGLPVTGGQIAGAALLGGVLIVGAIALLLAKRRRAGEADSAEEDGLLDAAEGSAEAGAAEGDGVERR